VPCPEPGSALGGTPPEVGPEARTTKPRPGPGTEARPAAGEPAGSWRALIVRSVWKGFDGPVGGPVWILRDVTLSFECGSFTCIVGPSGSGKTTLLNLLAGFEAPSHGLVALDEAPITGAGRERAVIFQDVANALFPWLTALENVEFGLRVQGLPRRASRERALAQLALVGLDGHGEKFPYQLSGGMKQRVQIARALANDPAILLMDEPFAALDAITRRDLQDELARLWATTRKTIVFVTHDLIEALLLATRVVVLGAHGVVQGDFAVQLTAPRSPADPEFMRLYDKLQGILANEVQRAKSGADRGGAADCRDSGAPREERP
jgi:NitT/TauT family transport system ATP-binding protein